MAIVFDSDAGTITGLSVGGLPDGTVDAGTLASNAVTAAKLATDSVTAAKLASDSVTAAKIAANSVDSAELVAGAIDDSHMASISGRKNMVINGAMQVAQRGTSSANTGRQTIDRFSVENGGNDELPTQAQHALTSSDTEVWAKGFRYSYHMTNGNQTGGAGSNDRVTFQYRMEAQDIASSGWDYTSSSSYITLSFWCKSSVAQNFYGTLDSKDGTRQGYAFETGSLTADTWTKVTKTIPGDSDLTFDNDTERGFDIEIIMFRGTDKTGTRPLNAWDTYDGATRVPDMDSTWYTTNNATWEITGVQLELGSTATDFEHRSYGEELALCQRYFFKTQPQTVDADTWSWGGAMTIAPNTGSRQTGGTFPVTMRASATVTVLSTDSSTGKVYRSGSHASASIPDSGENGFRLSVSGGISTSNDAAMCFYADAEL